MSADRIFGGLALAATILAACARAEDPTFRFSRPIVAAERTRDELLSVSLDAHVYEFTQDDFSDVRIYDSRQAPVPFVRRVALSSEAKVVRRFWPVQNPTARPLEGGGLEITLTLDEHDPQPGGLRLVTPLRDFEQRVRVFSSPDGQVWEPAGDGAVIFDYSRFIDVRNDNVTFPDSGRRQFRIVIDNVTAEQQSHLLELTRRLQSGREAERIERVTTERRPFRIDRVEFWNETREERTTGARQVTYPPLRFSISEESKDKQTIVDVETRREPLVAFELAVASRNFSREAQVRSPRSGAARTDWQTLGRATVSVIDFRDFSRAQPQISFPESRRDKYRIVIDDRDNPPLEITGVEPRGHVYELLFLATAGASYRLAYGNDSIQASIYDTAAVETLLRQGFEPQSATLAEPAEGPAAGPQAIRWSDLLSNPRFLLPMVVVLVAVLGLTLYRAARKINNLPPDRAQ